MSQLIKRLLGALALSFVAVFLQLAVFSLFPSHGKSSGSAIFSVLFLSTLFYSSGCSWISKIGAEWKLVAIQAGILLLSKSMSSYYYHWVCVGGDFDARFECIARADTLGSLGDGIASIILVSLTIWMLLRMRTSQ
jgi:hypothetical protein